MEQNITKHFGKRLRVRACGLLIEDKKILLAKHAYIGEAGYLWSPPGGEVLFSETAEEALKREFLEETGLEIEVYDLAFVHDFFDPPLHAIELFFWVGKKFEDDDLEPIKGTDPELASHEQIITQVSFLSLEQLKAENQKGLHEVLRYLTSWDDLHKRKGYSVASHI